MDALNLGHRFKRIPRPSLATNVDLDPAVLNENMEQWPHLNELVQCYKSDWIKDENKYGHYESIASKPFQSQIFEGPDTDVETEMRLSAARCSKLEDATDDELPTTFGQQPSTVNSEEVTIQSKIKFSDSLLPSYEPTFDWENERSMVFGQRNLDYFGMPFGSTGFKISVKVLSLSLQAGLVEPFYGTISLYNKERREKLSEDYYFHVQPMDTQEARVPTASRAVFSVDALSSSICLLVQLEKPATEDGGVSPSVYSRKEPVQLTEKERQRLQVWSRIMPYRESFAWAIVPLFESKDSGAAAGGSVSPSSPLTPAISGSNSHENVVDALAKITLVGRLAHYSSGSSVIVEISNLNKVKESYTEDSLQDPKRKVHKPIKGVLRLEIEKMHAGYDDLDNSSENGSITNDSLDVGDRCFDIAKCSSNGSNGLQHGPEWGAMDVKEGYKDGSNVSGGPCSDNVTDCFQAFDFRTLARSEPFSQLIHHLYLYPLTVSLSRKRNLFIRVELRNDDSDIRKQPLEAIYPRVVSAPLQKWTHTQVAVGARVACYHDEIKICLPVISTSQQHVLFTFFHVDLLTKLEAPKPVIIGYAALPLSGHAQLQSEISLPIMKELAPHYLQDGGKEGLDFLEDGKSIFRMRLRPCSSLYPTNERIRDFFLEYDRHALRTSPPWGSELLEAINSLKNVESMALMQFLQPVLNMLLHLIGDGGETLQV